ncbi:MAG: rod shape-determining protein MreC [Proteobacteria bacterium]|nr:rod shape-determining protein MreC [Pseudomonadota bacterium]
MFEKRLKKTLLALLFIYISANALYVAKPAIFNEGSFSVKIILFPTFAMRTIFNKTLEVFNTIMNSKNILKENEELKKRLDSLQLENMFLKRELENFQRLNNVENYAKKFPFSVEISKIVGRNPKLWHQYLIIDGGKNKYFTPGMPVVTKDGLIGKIVEVYDSYSKVLLLIDPEFSVDVRGEKSGVLALCSGIGTSVLKINYVPKFEELVLGETLVTSGLDGSFPEGIPVGYVIEINKPFGDYFLDAYVVPVVDILKIKEVIVIRAFHKKIK